MKTTYLLLILLAFGGCRLGDKLLGVKEREKETIYLYPTVTEMRVGIVSDPTIAVNDKFKSPKVAVTVEICNPSNDSCLQLPHTGGSVSINYGLKDEQLILYNAHALAPNHTVCKIKIIEGL